MALEGHLTSSPSPDPGKDPEPSCGGSNEGINIILEKEDEIESLLDSKAKKLNMNRTQVRTLLRQIIGSKELIDHSLQAAGEKTDPVASSSSIMEPRMTRTIARSVAEEGGKLDWVLETLQAQQASHSSVKEDDTLVLVTRELPEEDRPEDDPEYNPDINLNNSDLEPDEPESDCRTPQSYAATPSDSYLLEESPALYISEEDEDESNLHRLTRSKASLKEISIEELEKKFIPPDITSDMYATEMDDYALFLQETFGYQEPVLTGNSPGRQEEDPDFIFQDSEEKDDATYEFKFDRSTKIPRKEVDDLIAELLAEYEEGKGKTKPHVNEVELVKEASAEENNTPSSSSASHQSPIPEEESSKPEEAEEEEPYLTEEQIARICQQLRQHIQLLLQMALLTSNNSTWNILNRECKTMFTEITNRSLSKNFSIYAQDNLFTSLNFLQEWEDGGKSPSAPGLDFRNKSRAELSPFIIHAIGTSNCIIYPSLLPSMPLKVGMDKSYFSEAEDYLIIYGMEKYQVGKKISKKEVLRLISTHCMPPKTADQIRWRIKNSISKISPPNILKTYIRNGGVFTPLVDPLIPYDASQIKQPRLIPHLELPVFWSIAFSHSFPDEIEETRMNVPSPPIPIKIMPTEPQRLAKKPEAPYVRPLTKPAFIAIQPKAPLQVIASTYPSDGASSSPPLSVLREPPPSPEQVLISSSFPDMDSDENIASDLQEAGAGDIFLCVQETLPAETRNLFFDRIVKLTSDKARAKPADIFTELHSLCAGFSELQERLLDLLNPEDALSLGPEIYFQFRVRNFAKKFLKKVALLYKDDTKSMEVVVSGLQDIINMDPEKLDLLELQARAEKMFKSDRSLCADFMSFLPNVLMDDASLASLESEVDVVSDKGPSEFEKASLPKLTDIHQGSEKCICSCHTNESGEKRVHCVHCSLRFMNGQVYRKDGKTTRSLQVRYKDMNSSGVEVPRKKRKNIP